MKIFEYNPKLGGLSMGMEVFPQNEVVEVLKLSREAQYSYNNTHKQWFQHLNKTIDNYTTQNSFDLAILHPDIGENITKRGRHNFKTDDLEACFDFLAREKPKFAIIPVNIDGIPYLNTANSYVRDGFGELSKDFIIESLQNMGFKASLLAINMASYGVPINKNIAIYVATPPDHQIRVPRTGFSRFGNSSKRRFISIGEAIGDLGSLSEWSPYKTPALNVFQRNMRRSEGRCTWHFRKRPLTENQEIAIQGVKPGSSASKTPSVKPKRGYFRPKWDSVCKNLDEQYYLTSSLYSSIHPIENRPFTIREGCRLMGLPDTMTFELKYSPAKISKLVVNSISPIIGEIIAIAINATS